jgi:hypothetical protein
VIREVCLQRKKETMPIPKYFPSPVHLVAGGGDSWNILEYAQEKWFLGISGAGSEQGFAISLIF